MELVAARLEAALRVSAEWQAAVSTDELARAACADFARLIPADGVGWNEIDLRRRTLRIVTHPSDYFPAYDDRLAELIHENPLIQHMDETRGAARTFSDFVGAREFRRRQIYADVYGPHGVEDQLAAHFDVGPGAVIGIAFNRGARTFTRADRRLLDLLRSQLAAAYRQIRQRDEARARHEAVERALELRGHGLVVLGAREELVDASPLHGRWFRSGEVPAPGTYARDGAELTVRRVDGDPTLLLLDERRVAPDPERTRALGLTRREAQVVALAGHGFTNRRIAGELVLSARTVEKHLEQAFQKLGVHSRAEAAARLLEG